MMCVLVVDGYCRRPDWCWLVRGLVVAVRRCVWVGRVSRRVIVVSWVMVGFVDRGPFIFSAFSAVSITCDCWWVCCWGCSDSVSVLFSVPADLEGAWSALLGTLCPTDRLKRLGKIPFKETQESPQDPPKHPRPPCPPPPKQPRPATRKKNATAL